MGSEDGAVLFEPGGTLVNDVKIGTWDMPWNAKSAAGRLADAVRQGRLWAS